MDTVVVPCLRMVQGHRPGQVYQLTSDRTVLGRHPTCQIVLDNAAVSRHHAQVVEHHGGYFVEDLRSRNKTLLNGKPLSGRTQLADGDVLQVCDVQFTFHEHTPTDVDAAQVASTRQNAPTAEIPVEEEDGTSTILSRLNASSSTLRLNVKPEAKLRAIIEISRATGSRLKTSGVLDAALDGLFKIFPQAEEGFVLSRKEGGGKPVLEASKTRRLDQGGEVHVSQTVVQQALETREAILSADAFQDTRFDHSDSMPKLRIRSMMCVPLLSSGDEPLGVIQIGNLGRSEQFSSDDLDVMVAVASQVSMALENARLHEDLVRQRDTERELEFATQVQLGFLPRERPSVEGYEFFDFYEAALRVGGDYFDYVSFPDGRICLALGDVAGKGVPAALLMARLYSAARFHLLTQPSVGQALSALNREFASTGLGHRFVTYVVALLDPHRHELTVANAGHIPPVVLRKEGKVESLSKRDSGMPLGVVATQNYKETKVALQPGDSFLAFTDGVTEAMNDSGSIYTKKNLLRYLKEARRPLSEMVDGLVADVERFSAGQQKRDDVCILAAQRLD